MARRIIYHGSQVIVNKPEYNFHDSNPNNDYGLGFYCTSDIELAKEWACKSGANGYVNKYLINDDNLKILDLTDRTKYSVLNWIAILIHFRKLKADFIANYANELKFIETYYIDISSFDIVIGYRADDAYFAFPIMFIKSEISIKCLEDIYFLGDLGKQYVLISKKAFDHIKHISSSNVDEKYCIHYKERIDEAVRLFNSEITFDDRIKNKTIIDLVRGYQK